MTLIRWAPDAQFATLEEEVERMLAGTVSQAVRGNSPAGSLSRVAPIDVRRDGNALHIEAAVPGFSPDEITITAERGRLVIDAQREGESEKKEESYIRRERFAGRLYRELALPDGADVDNVSASVENGILKVTVPVAESSEPKRIRVSGSKRLGAASDGDTKAGSSDRSTAKTNGRVAAESGAGTGR
ncbi:MAG TPA: Hsp20/alpha crystallin family protein [Candidatus Dormibacteraeota bacterium]|nr:Hsp20/alpha crystallin family protein [Candidatus Dormibacteraeota bacterium]